MPSALSWSLRLSKDQQLTGDLCCVITIWEQLLSVASLGFLYAACSPTAILTALFLVLCPDGRAPCCWCSLRNTVSFLDDAS